MTKIVRGVLRATKRGSEDTTLQHFLDRCAMHWEAETKNMGTVQCSKMGYLKSVADQRENMAKIKIAVLMYGYGEGARAIVRIPRENKTGHVIMAINAGGGIMFVDPQTGKLAREGLWNEAIAENISAMRIDNKNFTGLITKCIEDI